MLAYVATCATPGFLLSVRGLPTLIRAERGAVHERYHSGGGLGAGGALNLPACVRYLALSNTLRALSLLAAGPPITAGASTKSRTSSDVGRG